MPVIVRTPTLVDAAGAAMAHRRILTETIGSQAPDTFWEKHTEEALLSYWHQQILQTKGRRIAFASRGRQVVGMAYVTPSPQDDHQLGPAPRNLDIAFFGIIRESYSPDIAQRLLDYVLDADTPAQAWVLRSDQVKRRFLRVNGFTMDGLSIVDEDSGQTISRMTR
ncbi:hypothetical protein [uncultured Varibaculum sp.]|uniref:hypothetical protein n=1 Tax=uncultured Varibaculum sp. TaxID=413896 RepID=UPI002804061F|nr:hypothetical protein [uncultured Varibaculum sp.]